MMAADDPEDVKDIAPWPTSKQVTAMSGKSTEVINTQGVILPPYHALCRTTTVEALS